MSKHTLTHAKKSVEFLATNGSNAESTMKKDSKKYSTFVADSTKESKSLLARLLASEGINVVHSEQAKTASFDVKNRTLILPTWEGMTNELYDMFVGHEVGHALFTPYNAKKEDASNHVGPWCADAQEIGGDRYGRIAQEYLNIIEDARIERMMKDKFPGLRRDFVLAYDELLSKDFFKLKDNSHMTRLFIDRANLHFKIGVSGQHDLKIEFSEKEKVFLDRMASTKTFEDVVQLTKDIFEYERDESKRRNKDQMEQSVTTKNSNGQNQDSDFDLSDLESRTEKLISDAKNSIKRLNKGYSNWIFPEPDLKELIFTSKDLDELISNRLEIRKLSSPNKEKDELAFHLYNHQQLCLQKLAIHHLNQNKKSVEILVKQFEMKKAASMHKRQFTSKSGRLDMEKIIQYRYNDDLFSKNLILRKGKNHGFVLFIDWSASMAESINDVIRHAFMIAQFCKKCNIPFVVYAFSDRGVKADLYATRRRLKLQKTNEVDIDSGELYTTEPSDQKTVWVWPKDCNGIERESSETETRAHVGEFNLIEVCSSRMNNSELVSAYAKMIHNNKNWNNSIFCTDAVNKKTVTVDGVVMPAFSDDLIQALRKWNPKYESDNSRIARDYQPPISWQMCNIIESFYIDSLSLSGTPLDETVWASNFVVNEFRKENKVEMMNTIFLTDGQGSQIFRPGPGKNYYDSTPAAVSCLIKTKNNIHNAFKVVDPALYRTGNEDSYSFTFRILMQLHKQYTGAKTMGIFVTSGNKNAWCGTTSVSRLLGMEEKLSDEIKIQNEIDEVTAMAVNQNYTDDMLDALDKLDLEYEKLMKSQAIKFEQELEELSSKKNSNAYLWKKEGYIVFNGIGNKRITGSLAQDGSSFSTNDHDPSTKAKSEIISAYDVLYCIRSNSLSKTPQNTIDQLQSGSTVATIKKAFTSQLKSSAMNKTLLMKIASSISGEI